MGKFNRRNKEKQAPKSPATPSTSPSSGSKKEKSRIRKRCWMCQYCSKICEKIKKEITPHNKACKEFTLTKAFPCWKKKCMMDTEVCLSIRKKKEQGDAKAIKLHKECKKGCKQGRMLDPFINSIPSSTPAANIQDEEQSVIKKKIDYKKRVTWGDIKRAVDKKINDGAFVHQIWIMGTHEWHGLKIKIDQIHYESSVDILDDVNKLPNFVPKEEDEQEKKVVENKKPKFKRRLKK